LSSIMLLIRQAQSQTQSEPVKFLRVSQHFKTSVTKQSDSFPVPRYLLHGGWFKASGCQDQYIFGELYQRSGPQEVVSQPIDLGLAYFRWDKVLYLRCGEWAFVVHSHDLAWSRDSEVFRGPIRQIYNHPLIFSDTPSGTDAAQRLLLRFTTSTIDPNTIYYKFHPHISMTHLFYYVDSSLDSLARVQQLMKGGLKLEDSLEIRLFKYFKQDFFEDAVQLSESDKLSRITRTGIELRANRLYELQNVHPQLAWKATANPQDRCSDIKIYFSVKTSSFGFNRNTVEFYLQNSDSGSLLGSNGRAVLTITGGGKQLMSPESAELTMTVGGASKSTARTIYFPVDGRVNRLVVQLQACYFSNNLYIRTILYFNDQHKLFGDGFKRLGFVPSDTPWSLFVRKTTNVTVGEESQVFLEQVRTDRSTIDLSFVSRVSSGSCLFGSPVLQSEFNFEQFCLICKDNVYNVGGICSLPNPLPTPALNSSCETFHSQQDCISCTQQSGLLYNKFRYVCYRPENCLAPNQIAGTGEELGKVCSDVPPASPVICNIYQSVNQANSCECKVPGCSICVDSPCDECATPNLFVKVDYGSSSCVEVIPTGYGVDSSNRKLIRKCATFGCTECSFDYRMCLQCDMVLAPYCQPYFVCDATCQTCKNPYPAGCLSCIAGLSLYASGVCSSCTDPEMTIDPTTNKCLPCDSNCKTCQEKPTVCTSCAAGQFLDLNTLTCQSSCGAGSFSTSVMLIQAVEAANVCKKCHSKCAECVNDSECTVCKQSGLTIPACKMQPHSNCTSTTNPSLFPAAGRFYYQVTEDTHYSNGSVSGTVTFTKCDGSCSSNCLVCMNQGICYSCAENYKLDSPSACTPCDTSAGKFIVGSLRDCGVCAGNCLKCQDYPDNCIECNPSTGIGLFNIGSSSNRRNRCRLCSGQSPIPNSFVLVGSECLPCNSNCETCGSHRGDCLTCIPNYYYYESERRCGLCDASGEFRDGKFCKLCNPTCATCSISADNCTSCFLSTPEKYLAGSTCVSCQEPGYTISTLETELGTIDVCLKCSSNCATCTFRQEFCTSCPVSLILYENSTCGNCQEEGVLLLNGICSRCDSSCAVCETTRNKCLKCANSLILNSDSTCGSCRVPGYYTDRSDLKDLKCIKCPDMCRTCINGVSCLTCADGLFKYQNGSCGECLESNHAKSFSQSCMPCHASCVTCRGVLETQCTSCTQDRYVTDEGRCSLKTPLKVISTGFDIDLKQASVDFDHTIQIQHRQHLEFECTTQGHFKSRTHRHF